MVVTAPPAARPSSSPSPVLLGALIGVTGLGRNAACSRGFHSNPPEASTTARARTARRPQRPPRPSRAQVVDAAAGDDLHAALLRRRHERGDQRAAHRPGALGVAPGDELGVDARRGPGVALGHRDRREVGRRAQPGREARVLRCRRTAGCPARGRARRPAIRGGSRGGAARRGRTRVSLVEPADGLPAGLDVPAQALLRHPAAGGRRQVGERRLGGVGELARPSGGWRAST